MVCVSRVSMVHRASFEQPRSPVASCADVSLRSAWGSPATNTSDPDGGGSISYRKRMPTDAPMSHAAAFLRRCWRVRACFMPNVCRCFGRTPNDAWPHTPLDAPLPTVSPLPRMEVARSGVSTISHRIHYDVIPIHPPAPPHTRQFFFWYGTSHDDVTPMHMLARRHLTLVAPPHVT